MIAYIDKKKKVKVKPATIKEQLMLFVNCVIENQVLIVKQRNV